MSFETRVRPPQGTLCATCLLRGHECRAMDYEGNDPVCLDCLDGELCVFQRRGGKVAAAVQAVELAPVTVQEEEESAAVSDARKCRHPECSTLLNGGNKSGVCTGHYYWGSKNTADGVVAAAPKKRKAPAAKPDEIELTPKGVIEAQQAARTVLLPERVVTVAVPSPAAERIAIYMDAEQIDQWWSSQAVACKAKLFQAYLDGQVAQ